MNKIVNRPCVYFITDGEYVKIGVSRNLKVRLSEIQSMNARELKILDVIYTNEMFLLESLLHRKYSDKRIRGEWFDIKDEIEKEIEEKRNKEAEKENEQLKRKRKEALRRYLTIKEIAEILQVKPKTIKRLSQRDDFPDMQMIESEYRILRSDFFEFMELHKNDKKLI